MATTTANPGAATHVEITLTRADRGVIANAIRSDLAAECQQILKSRLPDREDVVRIKALLDVYARQIETLDWSDGPTHLEMVCPTNQLDTVARDLPDFTPDQSLDHRLGVCALVEHFLRELHEAERA